MTEHSESPLPRVSYLPEPHMHTRCGEFLSGSGLTSVQCTRPYGHSVEPSEDPEPHLVPENFISVSRWQEWRYRQDRREGKPHVATAVGGGQVTGHEMAPPAEEPTKQREGDQPLPTPGVECVQDLVIAEMEESKRIGTERYGTPLMTFNGRKGMQDVAEEVRDLHVYLAQVMREAQADREALIGAVTKRIAAMPKDDFEERLEVGTQEEIARDFAQSAVDEVMNWVTAQRNEPFDVSDEMLASVLLDAMRDGTHAEMSLPQMADYMVHQIRWNVAWLSSGPT